MPKFLTTEDPRWLLYYEEYVAEFKAKHNRPPNKGREDVKLKCRAFDRVFKEIKEEETDDE